MRSEAPLVALEELSCAYSGSASPAIEDVDFAVPRHDFVGIVGPSGSGKTTVLRAMLGTVVPTKGHVHRLSGLRVGYVPQVETVDWNFPVTVGECVLMARRPEHRWPWRSRQEHLEVVSILERLGLAELVGRHIRRLSGGQQQRVFIARALLGQPDLLLMDEPTSGVDVRTRHEILHLLNDLHADGLTIVLTTHDLNGIATHMPRVVCLNRRVIAEGSPAEVLTPEVLEATYGAPMDVLEHGGLRVVVDRVPPLAPVIPLRKRA